MRGFSLFLVLLVVGFLFFGSVVVGPGGFAVYIKRQPSLDYIVSEVRGPLDLERLILTFNRRYWLMLVGYNERLGLRFFKTMPALP